MCMNIQNYVHNALKFLTVIYMYKCTYINVIVLVPYRSPYGICPSMGGSIPPDMSDAKNHILLFTIFNPMYPITVVSC